MVWDLESDTEYLLLHPTASELLHSEQPHTFVNTHRQQHAVVINTHDNVPFAIYPLHNSELKRDTVYDDDIWLSILSSGLQDTSTAPLDYLEVIEGDGHISIRRLGQTHQRQRIGVNPLYHPEDKHSAAFSVAMMRCLQNTTLKWNTRADFEYWLTERYLADSIEVYVTCFAKYLRSHLRGHQLLFAPHSSVAKRCNPSESNYIHSSITLQLFVQQRQLSNPVHYAFSILPDIY